jgi:hypothetical protein
MQSGTKRAIKDIVHETELYIFIRVNISRVQDMMVLDRNRIAQININSRQMHVNMCIINLNFSYQRILKIKRQ